MAPSLDAPSRSAISEDEPWTGPESIAFRFFFTYFSLYILVTQMLGALVPGPIPAFRSLESLPPILPLLRWSASRVFHIAVVPVVFSGSGDKYLDWILVFWILVISFISYAVFCLKKKNRKHDATLAVW